MPGTVEIESEHEIATSAAVPGTAMRTGEGGERNSKFEMAERAGGLILGFGDENPRMGTLTDDAPARAGMAETGADVHRFRELEDLDAGRLPLVENYDSG